MPDLSLVPPLDEDKNEDYLQRLEKAMDEQGIMPHRNLRISEVIHCLWNDTDPLSKDEYHTRILKLDTWQDIINSPYIPEMLEDLRQGNKYYMGIETEKGVLLFGRDAFGQHQSNNYLQRNIEEPFFDPDFKGGDTLTIYELRSWPSLMEGKINRCGDKYGMAFTLEEIPQNAYIKKSALRNVTDTETYNLAPTWQNYHELTDYNTGLNLSSSADNYDLAVLLYIKDKGYPQGRMFHEYPNEFSFEEKFEDIEEELAGKKIYDSQDEVQERARELAGNLLKAHFPDIRQENKVTIEKSIKAPKGLRL